MTNVEICNRALSLLGHDRTITSLSDTTTEAVRCAMFYPVALDEALAQFAWEWAVRTDTVTANTPKTLPADCVRVVDVRDANGNAVPTTRAGNTITATKSGTLRYVSNVTGTATPIETVFPAAFADAVVHQLAFLLYGPMLGNPTSKDAVEAQQAFSALAQAKLETAKSVELEEHAFMGSPEDPTSAAKTDVANRALAMAGATRLVRNFQEDPCHEAILCRQLYPMALNRVLASNDWEFARKTVTATASPYTLPTDFVSLVSVKNASGAPVFAKITDGTLVYDATGNMTVAYVSNDINAAKAPAAFQQALVSVLASILSPCLNAGDGGEQKTVALVQNAEAQIAYARMCETREASWMGAPTDPDNLAKTDFANRALALVGSSVTIKDFDKDERAEAVRCRQLLPMAMRRVLTAYAWEFAKKTVTASSSPYTLPNDFVTLVSVKNSTGKPIAAEIADGTLVFDGTNASVCYVTSDVNIGKMPTRTSDVVVTALALALAPSFSDSEKDPQATKAQLLMKQYEADLTSAIACETAESAWRGAPSDPDNLAKTDIANRALSLIGTSVTVKDYDHDSEETAIKCRQLLPMAMKRVLTSYAFEFAQKEISVVGATWIRTADFLRLVSVKDNDGNPVAARLDDNTVVFPALGNYKVRYVTSDVTFNRMPSAVMDAVTFQLAALLAPSFAKGESSGKMLETLFKQAASQIATAVEAEAKDASWMLEPGSGDDAIYTAIVNTALSMLGSPITVKDYRNETSVVAMRSRLLVPSAVDHVLRIKDWDFAAHEMTVLLAGTDESGYARFRMPEDCVRIVKVMDLARHPVETHRDREFLMVKTDEQKVTLRYVSNDFELNTATKDFVDLVATDLAERLAPTVVEDAKAVALLQQKMRTQFGETSMKESNETAFGGDWQNPFVSAR